MKSIGSILIAIGILMLASGVAYAANATDTIGASINGSPICTLTIDSSDLTITAPTGAGPSTTAFTNSPITMDLVDNDLDTVTSGTDILTVRISSSLPAQYGTGETYYVSLSAGTFTAGAASEIAAGEVSCSSAVSLTDSGQAALEFGTASGKIIDGEFSQPANLIINTDKRVYGDTSDSITIEYTLVDN